MAWPQVLLLIPPLTQLNTPYPSTAYLTGFLRSRDVPCEQADIGIEMVLRLFSRAGVQSLFREVRRYRGPLPKEACAMLRAEQAYVEWIEPVVEFLQGRTPHVATQLIRPGALPQGPRFNRRTRLARSTSVQDRAKLWATSYLEDLSDLVQAVVSPHFALNRYAEHLARSASSFASLVSALTEAPTYTDGLMMDALWAHVERLNPRLVGISVPFPGNLYGAFRIAQTIRQRRPDITIVLGGGYANTELRRLSDPRVFDYVDFVTLDDGERPILSLVEHLGGQRLRGELCRTFYRESGQVRYAKDTSENFSMNDVGCPTYDGLSLERYFTVLDSTNAMHRLWSEGHWNKLTVAHGCYWKQCTFCDVGLDYIGRYEMTATDRLVWRIEQLIDETGRRDFHFVDEAAPPAALKALALALLERDIRIRWWGNIRFEEAFSTDVSRLMAAAGCIAVTAGLEAASDRLLEQMKKGITVDQTVRVAAGFKDAGILVHAYLMYGFPSQTFQETIDSLERVRQLFFADLIQSAFWHRFTVTAHSPIGLNPKHNGVRILGPTFEGFADNDLIHQDGKGETPEWLGEGLRRSMLNFLERRGLAMDVRDWFDHKMPRPRVSSSWVRSVVKKRTLHDEVMAERRLVWVGEGPRREVLSKRTKLLLPGELSSTTIGLPAAQAQWCLDLIAAVTPRKGRSIPYPLLREAAVSFPADAGAFQAFLETPAWKAIRTAGLLLV